MAVRPIDAVQVLHNINLRRRPTPVSEFESGFNNGLNQARWEITHAPTLTQPNEPLTLEQLREMDGQPVFLETGEVSIREQLIAEWEILTEHDDSCFYFTLRKRGFHIKDYGKTWIAYRRPPEGEEK